MKERCSMNAHIDDIKRRVSPVLALHSVTRAAIFGSAARDEMKETSEVERRATWSSCTSAKAP